jgi:hypothetical protein
MCDTTYRLSRDTFTQLHEYVFTDKFEICGHLKKDGDNELKINNSEQGNMIADEYGDMRESCKAININKSPYYFHTHPIISRSYPSSEDITNILKHPQKYEVSVIATRWGIYMLKKSFYVLNNPLKDKNKLKIMKKDISNIIRWIGKIENDKGFKQDIYEKRLTTIELNEINKYINELIKLTNISIKFCPWNELGL